MKFVAAAPSEQPTGPYGPLVAMPELVPDALRAAVAKIAPSRVPALTQHVFEATSNAQRTSSLAPLRAFVHSWAVFVAIERIPERAARLRELERVVNEGLHDPTAAIAEIQAIREAAEAEAGL
ncbi:2-phosphoglycerate kinase [Streptomyces sp. SPB162]|nr:2-phosphoglycerate kinase [Streptomyces sp. SPB162]